MPDLSSNQAPPKDPTGERRRHQLEASSSRPKQRILGINNLAPKKHNNTSGGESYSNYDSDCYSSQSLEREAPPAGPKQEKSPLEPKQDELPRVTLKREPKSPLELKQDKLPGVTLKSEPKSR